MIVRFNHEGYTGKLDTETNYVQWRGMGFQSQAANAAMQASIQNAQLRQTIKSNIEKGLYDIG